MKTSGFVLILLLLLIQPVLGADKPTTKIDPILQQALFTKQIDTTRAVSGIELYAPGQRLSPSLGEVIGVLVKGSDEVMSRVRNLGGVIGSRHGDIYTAFLPLNTVESLASDPSVDFIESSRPLYETLDHSVAKTGADVLQGQVDAALRLTGKGVIVGETDTGINTDHPTFRTVNGKTRILYVWDQYNSGTPPSGFTYGSEHDSSQINGGTWRMDDANGVHGTHTSGIAAGNGLPSKRYVGMAPEADIIMISNQGGDLWDRGQTTVGTLDGYDYIRTKANALGKPFVINTSQGTNMGPHDGRTLFEQAINADVSAGAIICLSAGNEASSARHASGIVTTSTPNVFECSIRGGSGDVIPLDMWYETADRMQIEVKKSSGATYSTPVVPGASQTISFDSVDVTITSTLNSPLNGDNEIYLTATLKYAISTAYRMMFRMSAYGGNTLPAGGRIDMWWERNYSVGFLNNVDMSMTVGMPGCADSAITVASYENYYSGSPEAISSFSGRGPRRDGKLKPDIAGVGGYVYSSIPPAGSYGVMSGTSMSSPHVAGAVALLLQKYPTYKSAQIRQLIRSGAVSDAYTGSVPNTTWGYGKLNVLRSINYSGTFPQPPASPAAVLSGANAVLTWADPTLYIDGSTLTNLNRIYIYRNGVLRDSVNAGVQTYTDPSLPFGTYGYYLIAHTSGNRCSGKSTSVNVVRFQKANSILVVADAAGRYLSYYTNALSAAGRAYDVWDCLVNGSVTSDALQQYVSTNGGVIWFTGDDYSSTLDANEQSVVSTYLGAGGRLFISGQDIGYDLSVTGSTSDKAFYQDYLKATFVQDNVAVLGIRGASGGMLDGLTFTISGGTGANNQAFPDEIDPISPATSILFYDASITSSLSSEGYAGGKTTRDISMSVISSGTAALQYEQGSRRVVYFSFGFEAINTDNMRANVMSKVADWLFGAVPSQWKLNPFAKPLKSTLRGLATGRWGDYVYILGGDTAGTSSSIVDLVAVTKIQADSSLGAWTTTTKLPAQVWEGDAVVYQNYIYFIGGYSSGGGTSSVYRAPINTDGTLGAWTAQTSLPTTMYGHCAILYGKKVYIAGSWSDARCFVGTIDASGALGSWQAVASLPTWQYTCQTIVYNSRLYEFGGYDLNTSDPYYSRWVRYAQIQADGTLGSWNATTPLPSMRTFHEVVNAGSTVYVIGGAGNDTVTVGTINADGSLTWTNDGHIPNASSGNGLVLRGRNLYYIPGTNSSSIYYKTITAPAITWDATINVTDATVGTGVLTFGQSVTATDGLDPGLGEVVLPPAPPSGIFDARSILPVTPPVASLKDYRSDTKTTMAWRMTFQPGAGGYPMTFTWNSAILPSGMYFFLRDEITGTIVNVDMTKQNSYTLTNSALSSLKIDAGILVHTDVAMAAGWNLFSVPSAAASMAVADLFPGAASTAYAYSAGYVSASTLSTGKGYWLKFNSATTFPINGVPVSVRDIAASASWNMIGPFETDVDATTITTTPTGIVSSLYYAYQSASGYVSATTLARGKGYWIKTTAAGTLHLPAGVYKTRVTVPTISASWPRISVTDAEGRKSVLRLAKASEMTSSFELPPIPPAGIMDVRFSSGTCVEQLGSIHHVLQISSAVFPVQLSATNLQKMSLHLRDPFNGSVLDQVLHDEMTVTIAAPLSFILVTQEGEAAQDVPREFALHQNYPNPFNPSTTIQIDLPVASTVHLTMYNTLGEVVREVVNGHVEAGVHRIEVNCSTLASGVYFYRLEAGNFISVKKMALLK